MKMSINAALSLMNGLAQLDGYDKVIRQGDADRSVHVGYTLPSATKISIALNRKRIGDVINVFNENRNNLVREFAESGDQIKDPVKVTEFRKREKEMLDKEEEFNLIIISIENLRLDDANNQNISPSLLIMIAPILSDFDRT